MDRYELKYDQSDRAGGTVCRRGDMVHPVLHGAGYPPENGKMVAEYDSVQSVPVLRKILQGIFPWYCEIAPWDSGGMENSTFVPCSLRGRVFRFNTVL